MLRNTGEIGRNALEVLGQIERSLFMIEWYSSPALRRRCQAGLNKGEAAHKLKRAVFFHEHGEIRDRSFESQAFRASGLNLVVSAIVHWNTVYIEGAVTHLRKMHREIPDHLLKRIRRKRRSWQWCSGQITSRPACLQVTRAPRSWPTSLREQANASLKRRSNWELI